MADQQPQKMLKFESSRIHGFGGFATAPISAGTRVIEYVGEQISKADSVRRCATGNTFIFELSDEWDLDGAVAWNPARFLNHSCAPNCDAELIDGHIWIIARRDIVAGEEISFNYGYDFEDHREHPCRCGTKECVGYIVAEELLDSVRGRQPLETARTHGTSGEQTR